MNKKEMLLRLIAHYEQGNKANMAKRLGITPQAISTWLARETFDIELLYAKCEYLSGEWLLSGKGEMIRKEALLTDSTPIPVYNAEASAGGGVLRLGSEFINHYLQVPFARKGDIALTTVGNSMLPVICTGDLLVVREKTNWHEHLEPGKIYVIVTNEEIYVKVISEVLPDKSLLLHSYNGEYSDFRVSAQYIHSIFRVVSILSQRN
ncbi:MAG: S24 family peptidase [Bacteroidales bacterium]